MKYLDAGAKLSDCGRFRYRLWRIWDKSKPVLTWVMLNPSTADALLDDPTILKCVGFGMKWGYGAIEVVNLYAYRATSPADLKAADWPIGPDNDNDNDKHLKWSVIFGQRVLAAWGTHAQEARVDAFLDKWPGLELGCLGMNRGGSPKHPLYVGYEVEPIRWRKLW